MRVRKLLLVKCKQALCNWTKEFLLFCFYNFLFLLDLRICFCLKRAKPWLEFIITFNRYRMKSFQRALVGFNNPWINFPFRKLNSISMSKIHSTALKIVELGAWEVAFSSVLEEFVYSFFSFPFSIFCNSIYLTYVP